MQFVDLAEEDVFGAADAFYGLAGHRLREEHDEVAGVALLQRDADFAVHLEAANAGAVAGARVYHHEGAQRRVGGRAAGRRQDGGERVVGRVRQGAAVQDDFVVEHQYRRFAALHVPQVVGAAVMLHVPVEDGTLPGVAPVAGDGVGGEEF